MNRLKEFVSDEDALLERFEDAYNEDLLVNTKIELDALILSLSENINKQDPYVECQYDI